MTIARHLPLLEQHHPDSQRAALALIKAQQPQETTQAGGRQYSSRV